MIDWKFFDFVNSAGTNPIAKWYRKKLSVQEQSDLVELLTILQKKRVWGEPEYKTLSGEKYRGLGEIRLKGDQGVPLRLVGFRDPNSAVFKFTFLIGCFHQKTYDPPNALDTAVDRKKDLDNERATTFEHEFDADEETDEE